MKLRPPYVIKLEELEPAKNGFAQDTKLPFTGNSVSFTIIYDFFFLIIAK